MGERCTDVYGTEKRESQPLSETFRNQRQPTIGGQLCTPRPRKCADTTCCSCCRALEADRKSLQSLSVQSSASKHSSVCGHSRQGSVSSVLSNQSASSNFSNLPGDETGQWAGYGRVG